jgi:hypothetical protein
MKEVFDRKITAQAKIFLNNMCENVLILKDKEDKKTQIKALADEVFYRNFIDIHQIKIALYKLTAYKMKRFTESKFEKNEQFEKKALQEARKISKIILESSIQRTLVSYTRYITIAKKAAIKLQSNFRGKLSRLIYKMELMNYRIELENDKAAERARSKSRSSV